MSISLPKQNATDEFPGDEPCYLIMPQQAEIVLEALRIANLASKMSLEYWTDGSNTKQAVALTSERAIKLLTKEPLK